MTELTTAQPARHPSPTTRAQALAFLAFERPDLDVAERFLCDFGLRVAESRGDTRYLRAAGPEPFCIVLRRGPSPRFTGLGLELPSEDALRDLAAATGSAVTPFDAPGGGMTTRLFDPAGFVVHAVAGAARSTAFPPRAPLLLNNAAAQPRVNATQRLPVSPPDVLRLGHVVVEVPNFQETCAWYVRHFGLIPSDVQVLPDGSPAVVFLRLDRGDTPADHHTLALAQGVTAAYSHSAYEVVDTDAVAMGGRVLAERGYTHAWGIGRHILGSQIFDYWCDPSGDKFEHYTDGDLVTADVPLGVHAASRDAMAQWGPPMPRSFTKPRLSPAILVEIARNVKNTPDLTLDKLRTLKRLFG